MNKSTDNITDQGYSPGKLRSLENLKPPWKKGQSGNPCGLKKGTKQSLQTRMKRLLKKRSLSEALDILGDELLALNIISQAVTLAALYGDPKAVELIIKRGGS